MRRLLMVCGLAWAAPVVAQPGPLVIVGGGTQPPALVEEFVRYAGGPGQGRVVVLAMASASGDRSGAAKAAALRALGVRAENLWFAREAADHDSIVARLDSATGIWFGGGDQARLMSVLRGTRAEHAIRRRHREGAVIGGTSAGAAVISDLMITGEERTTTARVDTAQDWTTIARNSVVTEPGLGLLPTAIIDQHFVRRKRGNRLLTLVLEHPALYGVGIDEGTALIVERDGQWRVAGASVVMIYSARASTITSPPAPLGGNALSVHVLPQGSRFNPITGGAQMP
jgi:cyanophycinase